MNEALEKAKDEARANATKHDYTPENIAKSFRKGSGSEIVYSILKEADGPITLAALTEQYVAAGKENPSRAKDVVNWFTRKKIAAKVDGGYELVAAKAEL